MYQLYVSIVRQCINCMFQLYVSVSTVCFSCTSVYQLYVSIVRQCINCMFQLYVSVSTLYVSIVRQCINCMFQLYVSISTVCFNCTSVYQLYVSNVSQCYNLTSLFNDTNSIECQSVTTCLFVCGSGFRYASGPVQTLHQRRSSIFQESHDVLGKLCKNWVRTIL